MKLRFRRLSGVASLVVLLVTGPVRKSFADLLIEEEFDYQIGALLDGQNEGTGFSAVWDDLFNTSNTIAEGLNYTGSMGTPLRISGGSVLLSNSSILTSENERNFDNITRPDGSVMWFSFLLRKETEGALNMVGDVGQLRIFTSSGQPQANLYIGDTSTDTRIGLTRQPAGGLLPTYSSVTISLGVTYLLTGRFSFNAGTASDRLDLFINPEPGIEPTRTPDASYTSLNVPGLDRVRIAASNHTNGAGYRMDEIRIGDTYQDVTPTPEPGTLGLLGAGLWPLLRRRQNARKPMA